MTKQDIIDIWKDLATHEKIEVIDVLIMFIAAPFIGMLDGYVAWKVILFGGLSLLGISVCIAIAIDLIREKKEKELERTARRERYYRIGK